jgi:hypothetical protein
MVGDAHSHQGMYHLERICARTTESNVVGGSIRCVVCALTEEEGIWVMGSGRLKYEMVEMIHPWIYLKPKNVR